MCRPRAFTDPIDIGGRNGDTGRPTTTTDPTDIGMRPREMEDPSPPAAVAPLRGDDGRVGAVRAAALLRRFHPYRADALDRALDTLVRELWAPEAARRTHALRRLCVVLNDGHAVVRSPHDRDLFGEAVPPVRLRWIDGAPTVSRILHPLAHALGVRVGDQVVSVDGEPVARRAARLRPLLSAGSDAARDLYVANRILSGPAGSEARLILRGADRRARDVRLPRDPGLFPDGPVAERDTPPVRVLPGGIGYLDLDRLQPAQIPDAMARLRSCRGLLADLRGAANANGWALVPFLAARDRTPLARFVCPVVAADGWLAGGGLERTVVARSGPGPWRWRGRVACLVDERTQSQSELTALFLSACGAVCVGAPTAGALGDVVDIRAGDGVRLSLSGQRVLGADGREVRRVGLARAVDARQSLAGMRAGRDEILEVARRLLLS